MRSTTGQDVERAAAETASSLGPHTGLDWQVGRFPRLVLLDDRGAHRARPHGVRHPGDLPHAVRIPAPGPARPPGHAPRRGAGGGVGERPPAELGGHGRRSVGPAWHWGPCDPAGFAAMGVAELLLHTYDIARGLRLPWRPPPGLCAPVLSRLFPDAPQGPPTEVLLWSAGRIALPGRPRRASWSWRAALTESPAAGATTGHAARRTDR